MIKLNSEGKVICPMCGSVMEENKEMRVKSVSERTLLFCKKCPAVLCFREKINIVAS